MSYKKPIFEGVPDKKVDKSTFNLSHEWVCAYVPGYLQPVMLLETLPGDYWKINSEFFFRMSPLYFPMMQRMTMRVNYFKIPNRILWKGDAADGPGWTTWLAELNEETHPTVSPNMGVESSASQFNYNIFSKFGIPEVTYENPPDGLTLYVEGLNAFPASAYLKIWDEYYRIPQLEDQRWFPLVAGDNTGSFENAFGGTGFTMFSSKWEQDYFTAALPTPQVGDAITIPISEEATVVRTADGTAVATGVVNMASPAADGTGTLQRAGEDLVVDNAGTIRELRLAETLQHYYERILKVGQRYRDFIKGLWGNDPQPGLIDRPVLFGSKFGMVQVSDVLTQADTIYSAGGNNRLTGDFTGQANLYSKDNDFMEVYCEEHGFLMAILEINPNTSYGQGVHRMWRKSVQTDYALDLFAGIGDQEILKEEIYRLFVTADLDKNNDTFGYIPRFSEYKYYPNMKISEMQRSTGLSMHLGRHWEGNYMGSNGGMDDLSIGNAFTNVTTTPLTLEPDDNASNGHIRITDVFRTLPIQYSAEGSKLPGEGVVFCHIYHSIYVDRNLPYFSTPKL